MSAPRRRSATAPLRTVAAAPAAAAAPPVEPLPLIDGAQPLPYDGRKAVRALAKADPALGKLIERVGPLRLQLRPIDTPFEALAQAIVYQQLSGKAAATIYGRVRALFPDGKLHPEHLLALEESVLRGAGLSGGKQRAIRDLAEKSLGGLVPDGAMLALMEEAEIVERLTTVRGIGRWTVEMLLIFRLGRPDVLPVNDLGVRKGFQIAFRKKALPEPAHIEERGEKWRPWRSVASWYLWRANEL